MDQEFLDHLSQIRMAFEPFAAGLAAENATSEDVAELYRLVDEMAAPGHTPETLAVADLKFHLCIAEASRNPFMRTVGSLIEAALVGVFKLSSPASGENRTEEVSIAHRKIVDAIAARDREGAAEAMRRVILTGRERVRNALQELNR